ncbi:aminomethyltransferase family protein [Hwanghaeella sp.]|uniref:aminomethyltransferase family protein n=1 Tax=Hwanghaeella sp. TaxID=2605943 RepID=UPI003CCBC556
MTGHWPNLRDGLPVRRGLVETPFDRHLRPFSIAEDWVPWAGFVSARRFETVEVEYFAIRNQATLFDISPMHKYAITGKDALKVVNRLLTRNAAKMRDNRVGYSVWCDEDGSVIDDGTLFRFSETSFQLCCQEPQYTWLHDIAWGFDVSIEDQSESIAGLALQGPTSFSVLQAAGFSGIDKLKPFDVVELSPGLKLSRTGFTGDLGYELWVDAEKADELWERLWPAGRNYGLRPIGGDALNMARIEAGFIAARVDFQPIHDAQRPTRGRTPFELGLDWLVDFNKGHFNGRRALLEAKRRGPRTMLVGLEIEGHKPAQDAFVYHGKKKEAGHITSALWSPTCKRNLALAELRAPYGVSITDDLWVEIYHPKEGKWEKVMARAKIAERPFFKNDRRTATPPGRF